MPWGAKGAKVVVMFVKAGIQGSLQPTPLVQE
jgi:hypothetical protein